jgi:hypothetical protein
VAQQGQWSSEHTKVYNCLDKTITEAMLHAEKECSKKYTKIYDWSSTLVQAVKSVNFWQLLLKRSIGISVLLNTITCTLHNAGLPSSFLDLHDLPCILQHLQTARTDMHVLQNSHLELREMYLTSLAEAIILVKHPYLGKDKHIASLHLLYRHPCRHCK